jgi:hypothetical protein
MRPESVEIKATISIAQVTETIGDLGLTGGKQWSILFCEDVTAAVAPSMPLLDTGVILRARKKSGAKGDSTVKLRPCRWSQLDDKFFADHKDESDDTELKIEADWAGPNRALTASMTVDWSDGRLDAVLAGDVGPVELYSAQQLDFLASCSRGRVNLAAITALPVFTATRWDAIPADIGGVELSIRPERWTIPDGDDFLELSIVSDPERAEADQVALDGFLAARSLTVEQGQENKTQRVLRELVGRALATN